MGSLGIPCGSLSKLSSYCSCNCLTMEAALHTHKLSQKAMAPQSNN